MENESSVIQRIWNLVRALGTTEEAVVDAWIERNCGVVECADRALLFYLFDGNDMLGQTAILLRNELAYLHKHGQWRDRPMVLGEFSRAGEWKDL